MAITVEEFLTSRGLANQLIHACLSLPFAVSCSAVNSGELAYVTKGFTIRQNNGTELLSTFQEHLNKKASVLLSIHTYIICRP